MSNAKNQAYILPIFVSQRLAIVDAQVLDKDRGTELKVEKHLGPPPSINQARVTLRDSPGGVGYLTPGRPHPAHRKAGSVQRSPWRRRGGADASRPPSRSRLGCNSPRLPHRKRPRARAGRQPRVPHAGRGRRAGPPPPGGARGPGGAAVPSGERWPPPPRPPGSFPPRPPAALGDASPITARGEP
ncbi:hypothetical protein J1605_004670 [Eschrichtius robustus]|uniref:Uncharacterized protein n=1 Tax=Eschrichtius robustus TaxID=9764 RepID=A0AB34HDC6_ESCRO|nr:hypothetical protein J1605_004670 [Eschrichtius robustus]